MSNYTLVGTNLSTACDLSSTSLLISSGTLHSWLLLRPEAQLKLHDCISTDSHFSGFWDDDFKNDFPHSRLRNLRLYLRPGLSNLPGSTLYFEASIDVYMDNSLLIPMQGSLEMVTTELKLIHPMLNVGELILLFLFKEEWNLEPEKKSPWERVDVSLQILPNWKFQKARVLNTSSLICLLSMNIIYMDWQISVRTMEITPGFVIEGYKILQTDSLYNQSPARMTQVLMQVYSGQRRVTIPANVSISNVNDIDLYLDWTSKQSDEVKLLEHVLWEYDQPDVHLKPDGQIQLQLRWSRELLNSMMFTSIKCDVQVQIRTNQFLNLKHTLRPYQTGQFTGTELSQALMCQNCMLNNWGILEGGLHLDSTGYTIGADLLSELPINDKLLIENLVMQIRKSHSDLEAEVYFSGDISIGEEINIEMAGYYDYQECQLWLRGGWGVMDFADLINNIVISQRKSGIQKRSPFSICSRVNFYYELTSGEFRVEALSLLELDSDSNLVIRNQQPDHLFKIVYTHRSDSSEELRFKCIETSEHECDLSQVFQDPKMEIFELTRQVRLNIDDTLK
jgi:hypothetical protein